MTKASRSSPLAGYVTLPDDAAQTLDPGDAAAVGASAPTLSDSIEPITAGLDLQLAPPVDPAHARAPKLPAALTGTLLGERYRVEQVLARGGMGWVFRAIHERLNKLVAVKVLMRPEDEEARLRFRREAQLMCRVRHPHVVDAEDYGETPDGQPYLVLEYQDGPTLAAELAARGRLPAARSTDIALQIVEALEAIHQRGIIHRDLKPSNVFLLGPVSGRDVVRIGDFGLARSVRPGTLETRLTRPGRLMGTPEYMAPEIALGQDATVASDQYALGCTLYEMLSGAPPFQSQVWHATLLHQVQKPLPSLRGRVPDLPAALEAVVLRLLSKDPTQRYQNLVDLRLALQRVTT